MAGIAPGAHAGRTVGYACFPGREAVFGTPAGADDRAAALVPPPAHPLGDPRRHPRGLHLRHHGALPRPSWGTVMCTTSATSATTTTPPRSAPAADPRPWPPCATWPSES